MSPHYWLMIHHSSGVRESGVHNGLHSSVDTAFLSE